MMVSDKIITKCKQLIQESDAVLIGAGAGLSAAGGLLYGGKRFTDNFPDFIEKYDLTDMYSTAFYPFKTPEEKWAYWSRYIKINRFDSEIGQVYFELLKMVNDKSYFVITTNADAQFLRAGFDDRRIFYMQGDYTEFQCSEPCHNTIYDNKEMVFEMVEKQSDCRIPSELIPYCLKCGEQMKPHLRMDNTFIENEGWHKAQSRYVDFLTTFKESKILLIELGIGFNTPGIIRYPFEQMVNRFPDSHLVRINMDNVDSYADINSEKTTLIKGDIAEVTRLMVA